MNAKTFSINCLICVSAHPLNLPVSSLKASDGDSGSNAEISYTISSGNDDGAFSLDARYSLGLGQSAETRAPK